MAVVLEQDVHGMNRGRRGAGRAAGAGDYNLREAGLVVSGYTQQTRPETATHLRIGSLSIALRTWGGVPAEDVLAAEAQE